MSLHRHSSRGKEIIIFTIVHRQLSLSFNVTKRVFVVLVVVVCQEMYGKDVCTCMGCLIIANTVFAAVLVLITPATV